ncbi:MAG TPA: S53 family peptidase [Xanthomonadaceae bacterium]
MKASSFDPCHRGTSVSRKSACALLIAAGLAAAAASQAGVANRLQIANIPEAVASGHAARIAAMDEGRSLQFSLVLPLHDQAELDALLARLQDPASADYHHYLSVAEFTERFGASAADYAEVVRWAGANGLKVVETGPNRHVVTVAGSVAAINRALHVQMTTFRHPTEARSFFAPDREPTLDLRVPLLAISDLSDVNAKINHLRRGSAIEHMDAVSRAHGSGPGGEYLPSDMRAAYYRNGQMTGAGQSVGIFSFDGYKTADIALFYTRTGMTSNVPVNNVLVGGFSGACSGGSNCDDGEQILDIVNVIGMAPGLAQVQFYEGNGATAILNRMVSDNTSKVFSCSWGGGGFNNKTDDAIYQEMAAQGQTFLNATGDDGAYNSQTWAAPSADANIIDVGGTSLVTTGPGGTWVSEKGWLDSGGGFYSKAGESTPAYQSLAGVLTSANQGSGTYRNDPDVAAEADFDNPTVSNGSFQTGFGGTSFAAPRWAGLIALANQKSVSLGKGTVGFINTKIYNIGLGSTYHNDFHDILHGNNAPDLGSGAGFNAVAGFDLVTGWGSPIGAGFVTALTK